MRPGFSLSQLSPDIGTSPSPDDCSSFPSVCGYLRQDERRVRHLRTNYLLKSDLRICTCAETAACFFTCDDVLRHGQALSEECRPKARQQQQKPFSPRKRNSGSTSEHGQSFVIADGNRTGVVFRHEAASRRIIGFTRSGSSGSPNMTLPAQFFGPPSSKC